MHSASVLILGLAALHTVSGVPIPVRNLLTVPLTLTDQHSTSHNHPHATRALFANCSKRLPTSSGNITAYTNNAHIDSHLLKRSSGSNEIIECPQGFTPRGGSRISTCVSVHLKAEKQERESHEDVDWNIKANNEAKRGVLVIV